MNRPQIYWSISGLVHHHNSPLQWRHNACDGISIHWCLDSVLNRLFRRRSRKRKHQSSTSPAFVRGIHQWQVNSSYIVMWKMFPFDDIVMQQFWKRMPSWLMPFDTEKHSGNESSHQHTSIVFSCDQAALQMVFSVCLSVCLSVCHTFLTMFPSSYHHEIFRSYYQWPK